jgi:hypothetical protein
MGDLGGNGQGRCAQCGRMRPPVLSITFAGGATASYCTLDCARWAIHREIVRVGEKSSMGLDEHQNRCTMG